jgi:integrase
MPKASGGIMIGVKQRAVSLPSAQERRAGKADLGSVPPVATTLKTLGIRYRPPYNARHTYATMCLMAGMMPALIANQLGHSIQILLTRYPRWLDGTSDDLTKQRILSTHR